MLRIIKCDYFTQDMVKDLRISHLGKQRENYNRVVKITFPSVEVRNEMLKYTKHLKNAGNIWKKVCVKNDKHPVYASEIQTTERESRE